MELRKMMLLFVCVWIVTACDANPINATVHNETLLANVSMQLNGSSIIITCREGTHVKILNVNILGEIHENLNTTNRTISAADSARDQCENKTCFVMNLTHTEVRYCYNETYSPWKVLINYECIPLMHFKIADSWSGECGAACITGWLVATLLFLLCLGLIIALIKRRQKLNVFVSRNHNTTNQKPARQSVENTYEISPNYENTNITLPENDSDLELSAIRNTKLEIPGFSAGKLTLPVQVDKTVDVDWDDPAYCLEQPVIKVADKVPQKPAVIGPESARDVSIKFIDEVDDAKDVIDICVNKENKPIEAAPGRVAQNSTYFDAGNDDIIQGGALKRTRQLYVPGQLSPAHSSSSLQEWEDNLTYEATALQPSTTSTNPQHGNSPKKPIQRQQCMDFAKSPDAPEVDDDVTSESRDQSHVVDRACAHEEETLYEDIADDKLDPNVNKQRQSNDTTLNQVSQSKQDIHCQMSQSNGANADQTQGQSQETTMPETNDDEDDQEVYSYAKERKRQTDFETPYAYVSFEENTKKDNEPDETKESDGKKSESYPETNNFTEEQVGSTSTKKEEAIERTENTQL